MNWKSFFLGAAVGIVGGYVTKEILTQKTNVSPERVLGAVKKHLQPKGSIQGSWIHMEAEPYDKNQMTYRVYKGGISQNTDGNIKQYEFIADAQTGTLLDLIPFSP
ncbi:MULTISPECIES: PepSY domain-containing protein [Bacillaceae]|uniref:PepSY domain-containing protein n=1 Tax=Bacillaceae TaxID=186817 RepID=UPI002FFD91DF